MKKTSKHPDMKHDYKDRQTLRCEIKHSIPKQF